MFNLFIDLFKCRKCYTVKLVINIDTFFVNGEFEYFIITRTRWSVNITGEQNINPNFIF